jgi:prepilin-type N-terminal cleavage/methylation domain-containing protein
LNKQYIKRSGFTLIELLTVIAIIGILASILIPAVGKVRDVANKSTSSSNMRSIAVAHATYSTSSGKTRVITTSKLTTADTNGVASFLAQETGLIDAGLWRIDSDSVVLNAGAQPATVGVIVDNVYTETAGWAAAKTSYDFFVGVGGNDAQSTTPLLTTHGLTDAGVWTATTSPWGGGGHIAFLDAHVTWYNKLDTTEFGLVNVTNGTLSVNWEDAVRKDDVSLVTAVR